MWSLLQKQNTAKHTNRCIVVRTKPSDVITDVKIFSRISERLIIMQGHMSYVRALRLDSRNFLRSAVSDISMY